MGRMVWYTHRVHTGTMSIESVVAVFKVAMLCWVGAVLALVAYRCLTGGIELHGLFEHRDTEGGMPHFAPERVQLLAMFLFALVAYAVLGLRALGKSSLPDVPNELLLPLAGSHAIYLSGKARRMLFMKLGG
jgi:hypothetical protein